MVPVGLRNTQANGWPMKKLLLSTVAIMIVAGGNALAADLPRRAPYVAAPVAYGYNWSGCYIGVQGGFAALRTTNSFSLTGAPPYAADGDSDGNGGLFGGHIGCNYQVSNWVFGVEGDLEWAGIDGDDGGFGGDTNELSIRWMGSLRGRLGYAWSSTLLYMTGGAAFTGARSSVLDPGEQESHKRNHIVGWTLGAGLEQAFGNNWSARIEYRYTDFGSRGFNLPVNGYVERHNDISLHAIRLGLTYRFGGGGPIMASY
jgi:outer membrane immunogenic protein